MKICKAIELTAVEPVVFIVLVIIGVVSTMDVVVCASVSPKT